VGGQFFDGRPQGGVDAQGVGFFAGAGHGVAACVRVL
jgi:hypothetical protein